MSTNKFQYWPNTDGNLGNIKVQIPTNAEDWPDGDALIGNFVYSEGELVDLVDTKALIVNDTKTTTINYDYVNIELPFAEDAITINRGPRSKYLYIKFNGEEVEEGGSVIVTLKYKGCKTVDDVKAVDPDYLTNDIVDGVWSEGLGDLEDGGNEIVDYGMFFGCENLTSFTSDLSSLTYGSGMFGHCSNLVTFTTDLPNLIDGTYMFAKCEKMVTFISDLPNLKNGYRLLYDCPLLTLFAADNNGSALNLKSLTDAFQMFAYCSNLTSFSAKMPKLDYGQSMFHYCTKLTSFSSDLSSLTNGDSMFYNCKNLTSFNGDLSNLTNGDSMFSYCKLDTASVQNIADTINTPSSKGTIRIGIGNSTPNSEEEAAFNKIVSKNWTVYVGVNGRDASQWNPTSLTPIDGEQQTPIPFYAKPVQSDEKHAHYVDENGNFYNILGGNYIYGDDLSTYGMFTCEEDAAANMRLTKIEQKN